MQQQLVTRESNLRAESAVRGAMMFPSPSEPKSPRAEPAGPGVTADAEDGMIGLPGLDELGRRASSRRTSRESEAAEVKRARKKGIKRGDAEAYLRALEADPNADANPDLFERKPVESAQDVDLFSIILGEGADVFFGIESSYLQIGHVVLVAVILLMTYVHDGALPLTNLPQEYRDFFQQGLICVYIVNTGLAALAYFEAKERTQPTTFWTIKTLLLGGVAFNQLRTGTEKRPM